MYKLCLKEKLWMINQLNDNKILNKKSENIKKFKQVNRHLNKFLLKHVKKKQ